MQKRMSIFLAILFCLTEVVSAQITTNWIVGEGFFSDPASWDNGVPNNPDTAFFSNGGTFQTVMTAPEQIFGLRVNNGTDVALVGNNTLLANSAFVNGAGILTIFGEDTVLDVSLLELADVTDGAITVTQGGILKINGNGIVGVSLGETGFLQVENNATTTATDLVLGQLGNAAVTFTNATGTFGNVNLGDFAPANGSVSLSNSTWQADNMTVGDNGTGIFLADNNSNVEVESLIVGNVDGSSGVAAIRGGSDLQVIENMEIASIAGSLGELTVSGNLDFLGNNFVVGNEGSGCFFLEGAGSAHTDDVTLGNRTGSDGTVAMEGQATWDCDGSFTIGLQSAGTVNLSGNSILTVQDETTIGNSLVGGTLVIESGLLDANGIVVASAGAGACSDITITGSVSEMNCASSFVAGHFADSNLSVLNDATLVVGTDLTVGRFSNSDSTATFHDSSVLVGGNFEVGGTSAMAGTADVTFSRGEMMVMGDTLINANSMLEIAAFAGQANFSSEEIRNQGELRFTGVLSSQWETDIVNEPGGQLVFSAAVSIFLSGSLENNGEIVANSGFRTNGGYSGTGSVIGDDTCSLAGTVRPGNNGIGTMHFANNLVIVSDANLQIEIESETQMDRLVIDAELLLSSSLPSVLELTFADQFSPSIGEEYVICEISDFFGGGEFENYAQDDVVGLFDDVALVMTYEYGNGARILLNAVDRNEVVLLGDVNLDGNVDLLDVAPFVDRLSSGIYQLEADCNSDGQVDLLDVAPFVALLSGA